MKNEKLITFAIPCYNSEGCMENCIKSLLGERSRAEIIIIDDGSSDKTGEIADFYAAEYPDCIVAHHQENGGHGAGVNKGIALATGKYYKVVDSDDMLDSAALKRVLDTLEGLDEVDMFVANYVYVRTDTGERRPMKYKGVFPENRIFTWDDSRRFGVSQYLMMHSVIYRTSLLREHEIQLPKHTFYVDNLYMYAPFPYVKKLYYQNEDLYLYFVGGEEQSVSEKNLLKRIDQQVLVARLMIDSHDLQKVKAENKKLYRYMLHELSIILSICDVFLYITDTDESLEKVYSLWQYLKQKNKKAYCKLRLCSVAALTRIPTRAGRRLTVKIYRAVNKKYKLN